MKRKLTVTCIVIAVLALAYAAWLCAYRSQKSNDNLPGLASIAAMGEEEINESVCGYQRTQLNGMWGEPDEAGEAEDIWSLGDDRSLRVNYNKKEKAVACQVSPVLFPEGPQSVKMAYSAGTVVEMERDLTGEEITDVRDWASGLDLELQKYEAGEAPNEVYAGGEAYEFTVNDGEAAFSYLWIENYYIYKAGEWYLVKNPTLPPVDL